MREPILGIQDEICAICLEPSHDRICADCANPERVIGLRFADAYNRTRSVSVSAGIPTDQEISHVA